MTRLSRAAPTRPAPPRPAAEPVKLRPRTKPSDVRREELLLSGERLFLAKGVAATSIDDIAAGADIAKGTFYLYFAAKEDFLAALRERFSGSNRAHTNTRLAARPAGDWRGKLDAFVEGGISFYLDHVRLHDVLFHGDFHPRRRAGKSDNSMVAALADLLTQGSRAGAWSADEPAMTAVLLFHALHGAVDLAIARGREDGKDRLVRTVQRFFHHAVLPVPRLPRSRRR
jgi:AcrR family transcriptional regulator